SSRAIRRMGHSAIIRAAAVPHASGTIRSVVNVHALVGRMPRPAWPTRVWLHAARGLRLSWQAAGRCVVEFYNSSNLTFASSIAYYSILSFFPFVLLLLTLFGRLAVGMNEETLA